MTKTEPCRGDCAECKWYAKISKLKRATFRCSTCKQTVGYCEGGVADEHDPKGSKCNECWNKIATGAAA